GRPHLRSAEPPPEPDLRPGRHLRRRDDHLLRHRPGDQRGHAAAGAPLRPGPRHRRAGDAEVSAHAVPAQQRGNWDWDFALEIAPDIWEGMVETIKLTVVGISLALVLGLVFA